MKIVTDINELHRPSEPVKDIKEGGEISRLLQATLRQYNKRAVRKYRKAYGKTELIQGHGLSAPQIGIHKQVCVILVNDVPIVLMNPVIVAKSETTVPFEEGCMSLPGVKVEMRRHLWVEVDTLNRGRINLGPRVADGVTDVGPLLLKAIVAQHEIDHLHGRLITDKEVSLWNQTVQLS